MGLSNPPTIKRPDNTPFKTSSPPSTLIWQGGDILIASIKVTSVGSSILAILQGAILDILTRGVSAILSIGGNRIGSWTI